MYYSIKHTECFFFFFNCIPTSVYTFKLYVMYKTSKICDFMISSNLFSKKKKYIYKVCSEQLEISKNLHFHSNSSSLVHRKSVTHH